MLTAHRVVAFLVIAVCAVSAAAALVAYRRRGAAGRVVSQLLALAQTALVAQVGLGLLLLADHRRAADKLHYMYGSLALLIVGAVGTYFWRGFRGYDALGFTGVSACAGFAMFRVWRDRQTYA